MACIEGLCALEACAGKGEWIVKEYPENLRQYSTHYNGYVNQIDVKMLTGREAVEAEFQVSGC
jgi:hypothetical protein